MNTIITLEDKALYKIIDSVLEEYKEKIGAVQKIWITEDDAKELLGIKSKSTLQKLRDTDAIMYTQPMHKVILYNRESILEFLSAHSNR